MWNGADREGGSKAARARGRRRWAEDEAVREGPQMVGGWADWMGRKREREGWLSRHGRLGVDEARGKGRGGWFPCLASRNRYAGGNPAPPTPPTPYVIAPQRLNQPPVRSARLYSGLPLSPLQLVRLPTHNPPMRSARCANLIALTLDPPSVSYVVRRILRNCLNCVRERSRKRDPEVARNYAEKILWDDIVCRS